MSAQSAPAPSAPALLESALWRARRGEPVLPIWWTDPNGICACPKKKACSSPGKHPLTARGLDDATTDEDSIRGWWQRWPKANVAVRTDVTPRIDIDLVEVAEALAADAALPLTTGVVRTPRGGLHIAVAASEAVAGRDLILKDGRKLGDLKASRGYVLVPPSRIGNKSYETLGPQDINPMRVDPLGWLAKVLPEFGFALSLERAGTRQYTQRGGQIHEGDGRHNALVSYAGRIWVDGMESDTLVELLQVVNERQCQPPLPAPELKEIARHFIERRDQSERPTLRVVDDQFEPEYVSPDYSFEPATANAFVREFIRLREGTNDAPLEYAEAHAIGTLAAIAGPRLTIPVRQKPRPIACNLFVVIVGPSTIARKSDVQEHTHHLLKEIVPGHLIEAPGSSEALIQDLSSHQETGGVLFVDELAWWFAAAKRKTYLSEMKGYVMRAYDGSPLSRRNRAKLQKGRDGMMNRAEDADVADEPCLTILGTSTPERLAQVSSREDIDDGWWPRWIIVWPESRPPLRPMGPPDGAILELRAGVAARLQKVDGRLAGGVQALLTPQAWDTANKIFEALETRAVEEPDVAAFVSRMELRVLKVAALLALADDLAGRGNVIVQEGHVTDADRLCTRWLTDARRFAESVGLNEFEYSLNQAWRALIRMKGRRGPRRDIARAAHVQARVLDEIEKTLVDRGAIEVSEAPTNGRSQKVWMAV